jgi:hypothetical protein
MQLRSKGRVKEPEEIEADQIQLWPPVRLETAAGYYMRLIDNAAVSIGMVATPVQRSRR